LNGLDWSNILVQSLLVSNQSIWPIKTVQWNDNNQ
jgi:hypothetical protein